MFISSNFKCITKLKLLINIIFFLSVPLSKANVLNENQVQSGDPIAQPEILQLNQSKEFMSLTEIDITNETDDKNVQNPPHGTTPLDTNDRSTDTPRIPPVKNPVKNRRSICNKKEVGKNVKRRTKPKPSSSLKLRETPQQQQPTPPNLNDLIRGVQIFNDPRVTQDINAFKTLLDAFEQMKKARSQQEDSVPKATDDDDESGDHLNPRNARPVKVQLIPPSNYSFSGPKVNVNANKNFSMDYEDYVPPQYGDSNATEEDGDQADYRPVEASAPIKRSLRRLIVRESGPNPPKANTPKPSSKAPPVETHSKAPPETHSKAPAKVVPATSRTETSAVIRIVRNTTSDHFNSLQDLWKEYQIAIVTVPAVFLVLLLIIIIYLIGKTGRGYQSVPSSSYESDTETGTVQDDVSKNCPPQKEYLPYMEPEPKRYGVSESERIIKTLGGYTLIRTKESIEDLLNYVSKRVTPPSSGKSVATQVGNGPFQQPSLDPPTISQPPITESKAKQDEEEDEDDLVAVDDEKKITTPPQPEPKKKPTGCSPCCSPNRSDPASTISHPPKKPVRRRRKPRKSPSFFRGCLSGPTDESADGDDSSHRLPSNDECIQSVVTQGASLMKTEHPCKGTRNEMQEVLRTDVKGIDDMLTDGNWERAYYNKGGSVRFSDGQQEASESPGPESDRKVKCKKGPLPRIAASEDGVFTMKYYLGSSADLSEKNPVLQRPF